ncbi:5654_t:CDS:2 [Funneliformis mosseae]|uniref:5654_t:CDS:1 n=1 Tax=Funneliformis mosseae TaxID=27381 RepID=A0A9N9NER6_FUNMO|nr:5654_t:CDS:2 [Funneliformis mosseae]
MVVVPTSIIEMRQKLSRSPLSVRNESMNSTVQSSPADRREASSTMRIIGFVFGL